MKTSRRFALVVLVLLAVAGVADGVYLTRLHVQFEVKQTYDSGTCNQLSSKGCDVAVKSRWSAIAGVPVAFVGVATDAGIAAVGVLALAGRVAVALPLLFSLGIGGVAVSLLMAAVSVAEGSFCPFCVLWYGINAALLAAAWVALDRPWHRAVADVIGALRRPLGDPALPVFAVSLAVAFGVGHLVFGTMEAGMASEHRSEVASVTADIVKKKAVEPFEVPDGPYRGPADAKVVIVEFSDFQCPYCRKLWDTLEAVAAERPSEVRMVFAHFPLDSSCNPLVSSPMHPHACAAARAAECARRSGKFWQYADVLFHNQGELSPRDLLEYAGRLGMDRGAFEVCMGSDDVAARIQADIALAARLAVASTPTFFVNWHKAEGALPKPHVDELIRQLAP